MQIDRGINKVDFGEIGYVSRLFLIFNNIPKFCIEYEKIFTCYICNKLLASKNLYKSF